jgi:hypothetical protein
VEINLQSQRCGVGIQPLLSLKSGTVLIAFFQQIALQPDIGYLPNLEYFLKVINNFQCWQHNTMDHSEIHYLQINFCLYIIEQISFRLQRKIIMNKYLPNKAKLHKQKFLGNYLIYF